MFSNIILSLITVLIKTLTPSWKGYNAISGPKFVSTKGEVWPEPKHQTKHYRFHVFDSFNETFYITKPYFTCDILDEGISRVLIKNSDRKRNFVRSKHSKPDLKREEDYIFKKNKIQFKIALADPCEFHPYLEMNEAYNLSVNTDSVVLSSTSIWGILRGMNTFHHLLYFTDDYTELRFNITTIEDYPNYKHRGLLIDTGRHYLKVETIISIIDAMEMNKMNVLHWHIVDDQSFPYQSKRFPLLSAKGAFHPTMVYTKYDIQRIIKRGRLAGIRVIPEFDIPGHVRSWGQAYPDLLIQCYKNHKVIGLGPLNPINNHTYEFLQHLFQEVSDRFPEKYIHLGGDEVNTPCLLSNPKIRDYMRKHNIVNKYTLANEFMARVIKLLPNKTEFIIWQNLFDCGMELSNGTIIQVWRNKPTKAMIKILSVGNRIIFSESWYLDYLEKTWEAFYVQDPRQMIYKKRHNAAGFEAIIGGEAYMWGENVDDANIETRIWPRTSAVAERLWSGFNYKKSSVTVTDFTRSRIEEHFCRMRHLGVPVEPPNGPGFCIMPVS